MKNLLIAFTLFVVSLSPLRAFTQSREEFNGPFNSWADIKTRFGAKGDGKTDDTKAFQRAIDELFEPSRPGPRALNAYSVLYLPAGEYCISSTLVLKGKIGISIIGESPERTKIKWCGQDKDTLFWANGSAYFKIARITWDANGHKDMEGIGIHWKEKWNTGSSRSYATLNIELSDNNFIGGFNIGIGGGTFGPGGTNNNDSEITIRRCLFKDCTGAGIWIKGYNALDYWIYDCRFLSCFDGVYCTHGGYHVYHSFFSGSKHADVHNDNGYYVSVRGCYSENAGAFSLDEHLSSNPFKRIFEDNTIIHPARLPIEYYHLGKITLFDNRFAAAEDTLKLSVNTRSWAPGIYEVLSLHNTYPNKNAIRIASTPARLYSVGDQPQPVKAYAQAFLATLALTPAPAKRKILEVPPGSDAGAIQAILDQAAALKGQRPVVHFPAGMYNIDKPLIIAANSDMQLAGDGLVYASQLLQSGASPFLKKPMLLVKGPSYISIRDLQFGRDGDAPAMAAILFEGVDQQQAEVHIDQLYSHADTSLSVKDMNYLYVEKDNSFFTDGNFVSGGPLLQKGGGTARVACFGGQFNGLTVLKNGRFLAKDCWWEGAARIPVDLEGSGKVCIDGAMMAPANVDSNTTIRIRKFAGDVTLMNMYVQGGLLAEADNPDLRLLVWNIHFYHKMDPLQFLRNGGTYQGAFLGLTVQCFRTADPECKTIQSITDQLKGVQDVNAFLDVQTGFDRQNKPVPFRNLPSGVSNISISRVSLLGRLGNGIALNAK